MARERLLCADLDGDAQALAFRKQHRGAQRAGHLDDATGGHGEDFVGIAQRGIDRHAKRVQGRQAAQVMLEQIVGAGQLLRPAGQRLIDLREALGVFKRDHRLVGDGLQ